MNVIQETSPDVSINQFLDAIFRNLEVEGHVLLARQFRLGSGFQHAPFGSKTTEQWTHDMQGKAIYFNVSAVCEPLADENGQQNWRRRKQDCLFAHVLVLDDVGTKATVPPIEPSYKLESSAGNYQWGYVIHPCKNLNRYAAIVDAIAELGFADKGAGGYNRLMRVPGSVNLKPGRDHFVSRIIEWHPNRCWHLDELATKLGVDLSNLRVQSNDVSRSSVGCIIDDLVNDPLLTWLSDNGHVVNDTGGQWVEIRCPWSDQHTTGSDTAGYSPLGRGDNGWEERRAFKCMHEHCRERAFSDLRDWAAPQGGPLVQGHDPLPWLQARYTYIGDEKKVADMVQRPLGGVWVYDLEAWSNMNYHRIQVPGSDRPVLIKNAFLDARDTVIATTLKYVPGGEPVATVNGQQVVNSYIEPRHPETDETPDTFLEHIEFLVPDPDERQCFLDWLAYKFQNPAKRSYAVVLVAEDAFGIGRSWVGNIIEQALEGHVAKATLSQLIGKGTSADKNYNDWAAGCQFLIVDEAKDVSREDFWSAYETFKTRVDTSPVKFRSNAKYGKTKDDVMWFNCLIFTNHRDAMMIPDDDRRIAVLSNPTTKKDDTYYETLHRALDTEHEARRLYWWLIRRDVSRFNAAKPPITAAKIQMIQASKSPHDEIYEHLVENLEGDLATRKQITVHVKQTARALGYDQIEGSPQSAVRRIWRQMGSLQPTNKNGFRLKIDTVREEVRAIRGTGEWILETSEISSGRIVDEMKKNSDTVVNLHIST